MILRFLSYVLIGTALGMLGKLAIPASGKTWASNPNMFYLGAEVYPEKEVNSMLNGQFVQFSNGGRPVNPKKYAEYIISRGKLTEANGPEAIRYYVLPRLHPALELYLPSIIMLFAGSIIYIIQSEIKTRLTRQSSQRP